jgi:OFA family oxalate/formate antiporter-like MFS transporter
MLRRRYLILAIGSLLMLINGLIYAWSIFRAPLAGLFPEWTVTQISVTFTVSMVCFCLGSLLAGRLSVRLSARSILLLAALFFLVGFGGLSLFLSSDWPDVSLWLLYLLYGVLCGSGVGMIHNASLNALTKWFPDKVGMASGLLLFCFGFGGLVFGSIIQILLDVIGVRGVFLTLAVGVVALTATGAVIVRPPSVEEAGQLPSVLPGSAQTHATRGTASNKSDIGLAKMVTTSVFWVFALWNITICAAGLLVLNSAAVIAVAFGAPVVLGLLVSVTNGIGRLIIGWLYDVKGRDIAMKAGSLIMVAAGLLLVCGIASGMPLMVLVALPLVGASYGGSPPLLSAITSGFFGPTYYAQNLGVMVLSVIPGAIIGPLLSSALLEMDGGAYGSTFMMLLVIAVLALGLAFVMRRAAKAGGFE